jgi:amphiphysin
VDMPNAFIQIFDAIPGEAESQHVHIPYETPESTMQTVQSYARALTEVKEKLLPTLDRLDSKILQPSQEMKRTLEEIQKMVKKRAHKKIDYDRFTQSVRITTPYLLISD